MELDTGGNVRFEEWRDSLPLNEKQKHTFGLVKQLTLSKYFNPMPENEREAKKIKITRVAKIYNKFMRNNFEE